MPTDWRDEQAALDRIDLLAAELRGARRDAEVAALEWLVAMFLDDAFTEDDIRRFEEKPQVRLAEPHITWRSAAYWPHAGQRPAPPRAGDTE